MNTIYRQGELAILPQEAYSETEKMQHNTAFTEKLRQGVRDIEEGRGIAKSMTELETMEDGPWIKTCSKKSAT